MPKYSTLASLKLYSQTLDPQAATKDDATLTAALDRADMEFESHVGSAFDRATTLDAVPTTAFMDGAGWLWIDSADRGPVVSVSSVKVLNIAGTWDTMVWDADRLILPVVPASVVKCQPEWWTARIRPVTPPRVADPGRLTVRWSYTAGFETLPPSIPAMINRLAWWIYKLREMPTGRVVSLELGTTEMPVALPKDIIADFNTWRRVV